MHSPTYFSGLVKILENPKQTVFNDKIIKIEFRVLISPVRKKKSSKILLLVFWGILARDVKNYYQINDYILIEGYLSTKFPKTINSISSNYKKGQITVLKIYPFLLKANNILAKS